MGEAIIALGGQMRRRARGHPLANGPTIENHDILACLGEFVGDRHAGDTGADDGDVGLFLLVQGRSVVENGGLHPQGGAVLAAGIHRVTIPRHVLSRLLNR